MPQMAPLWWTTLFLMFLVFLLMTYINMYFLIKYKIKTKNFMKTKTKSINWKW